MKTTLIRQYPVEAFRVTPDTMAREVTEFDRDFRLSGWMNDGWLVKDPGTRWVSLEDADNLYHRPGATLLVVAGHCPMCGGVLAVDEAGVITCTDPRCENPLAAHQVLGEDETEHIIEIEAERFHLMHPLRERIGGELLTCQLHEWLSELDSFPAPIGRHRVIHIGIDQDSASLHDSPWHFEAVA